MLYNSTQSSSKDFSLALLISGTASTSFLFSILSNQEKERYHLIKTPKRKANWLQGRAIVKYLFLNGIQEKPFGLQIISKQNLEEFSPWMYQMIEVLPKDAAKGTCPRIWFHGKSFPMNLSISHSSGYSSACIDRKNPVGIDLENMIAGTQTFYQGNYTSTEIDWVKTSSQKSGVQQDWMFTLLWTLKEATIKSRITNDISVFEFPNLEIKINTEDIDFRQAYQNNTLGDKIQSFQFEVEGANQQGKAQAILTSTSKQILSAVKILI